MKYFAVILGFVSLYSWGAVTNHKTEEITAFKNADIEISFGDTHSHFRLADENAKKIYYFTSTERNSAKVELTNKDYRFLSKRISALLTEQSNDLEYCPRSKMTMTVVTKSKSTQRAACIGSTTPIAKDFTKLVNSLSLVL